MAKIAIIDTLYPDFIKSLPFDSKSTYAIEHQKVMDRKFGTSDFYSRNLRALGWDTLDIIANHEPLQRLCGEENGLHPDISLKYVALERLMDFKPDVIFMQDLSYFDAETLQRLQGWTLLAGQCSCPMPRYENVKAFDVLFTSFPHYLKKFQEAGVRAVYNPLAFESSVLQSFAFPGDDLGGGYWMVPQFGRFNDCVFIGGVGTPSHWRYGMEVLNHVAKEIPTFKWWGYGADLLSDGPLKQKYQGQAWGLDMYRILAQSKICLNRHGEVAENYANNMRLFEATGMGAMLLTDWKQNLGDFFTPDEAVTYTNPAQAVQKIKYYLEHEDERAAIAAAGQQRTLKDHTYAQRMKTVSDTLKEMLVAA